LYKSRLQDPRENLGYHFPAYIAEPSSEAAHFNPEDRSSVFLEVVGMRLKYYLGSRPRKQKSEKSQP
jgi:hypothetical protein